MKTQGIQTIQGCGNIVRKLQWLIGISLAGNILLTTYSFVTLRTTTEKIRTAESRTRVHGEIYNNIIRGKDAVADVLPPPEYIIEPLLTTHLLAVATDKTEIAKHTAALAALEKDFLERHAYWETNLAAGRLRDALVVTAAEPAVKFFEVLHQEFLPAIASGNRARAAELLHTRLTAEYTRQRAAVDQVVALTTEQYQADDAQLANLLKQSEQESANALRRANRMLAAVLLASLMAAGLGGWSIVRRITTSVRRIAHHLDEAAHQVSESASLSSASSQSLAEGASEQAASLQETSASLEEMSSMTKRNAENAEKANALAKQARSAAEKGSTHMQAMSTAMDAIKASSDDIAKIIKTIDEIAFQTNILALNAAVEAARAGEAGMGFAVVADEVRNLAQRSAQAAKETAAKIEGAISRTTQGVDISTQVATVLAEIVTQARQVDELAAEVAGASREQNQGITQINDAVQQMDKVTQANAANAEESAAAATQLNAQAEKMKSSVTELLLLVKGMNAPNSEATPSASHQKPKIQPSRTSISPAPSPANGNGHSPFTKSKRTLPVSQGPRQASDSPLDFDFQNF
jgi:methyl-accepting chemotaxis protein